MADVTMPVEVLAAGVHKGIEINEADLDQMVENFAALQSYIRPPVKLGHSGAQLLAGQRDGDPALGWVTALRRAGDKLVATLSGVPERLHDLIQKGRYKRVSAELALDFAASPWEKNLKTGRTGKVLTGLALLGADLPAVANLADLGTLLASETGGTFAVEPMPDAVVDEATEDTGDVGLTTHVLFPRTIASDVQDDVNTDAATTLTASEDGTMSDENQAALDELKAQHDGQIAELTAKLAALEARAEDAEKAAAQARIKAQATEAERFVEQYSSEKCLRLTTEPQRALARALYLHLAQGEAPVIPGAEAVTLKLSEKAVDLTGVDVLRGLLEALPDQKVLLTQTATPTAPEDEGDDDEPGDYAGRLARVAKDNGLNLSVDSERAQAVQLLTPILADERRKQLARLVH